MENEKSINEILQQLYISATDLTKIMPIGIMKARQYIDDVRNEMVEKKYFLPEGKTKVALTKLVRKKFGI